MNSTSDSKSLLEELKRRNLPPDAPETQTELPTAPTEMMPAPVETHPTAEEWTELLEMLSALYRITATEYDWLRSRDMSSLSSMRKELTRLAGETEAIRTLLEQDQRRGGTGWEEERAAFFSALAQPPAGAVLAGVAAPAAVLGGAVVGAVLCAEALDEQRPAPVTRPRGDKKARRRERELKIARGQKPDDYGEEQGPNLTL